MRLFLKHRVRVLKVRVAWKGKWILQDKDGRAHVAGYTIGLRHQLPPPGMCCWVKVAWLESINGSCCQGSLKLKLNVTIIFQWKNSQESKEGFDAQQQFSLPGNPSVDGEVTYLIVFDFSFGFKVPHECQGRRSCSAASSLSLGQGNA